MMKGIVILFDDNSEVFVKDSAFGGKTCVELCEDWAKNLTDGAFIPNLEIYKILKAENFEHLLEQISTLCQENGFDTVVFAHLNCPFYNLDFTKKLVDFHCEYKSEYTFADGYPAGFAPEVIHAGTVNILLQLIKTNQQKLGQKKVTKDSLFELIKTDINSFEVETLLAPEDWRLLRLCFDCSCKDNFMACKALYSSCNGQIQKDIVTLSSLASKNIDVLKTVPGFYNIQISDAVSSNAIYSPYAMCYSKLYKKNPANVSLAGHGEFNVMDFGKFAQLVDKIYDFSNSGVIGLSAFGEAFSNDALLQMIEKVLSYSGLSVFIETDGTLITDDFCSCLNEIVTKSAPRTNGWEKVMIAVNIDAFTAQTYGKIHKNCEPSGFEKALESVKRLNSVIPGSVYPQFTRMNENEEELENFFRYWKEEANPSGGQLIIQKYDDFAGLLPPCKPADLSPLERNPCWHLRRDITILTNGDVPKCRECVNTDIIGNVFENSLEEIWAKNNELLNAHICNKFEGKCGNCDEFYTYYF